VFPSPVDVGQDSEHVACFEVPGISSNVPGINAVLKALKFIGRLEIPPVP
jgi:hypothetical protein